MSVLKIAITSGDADGIGTEVIAKALSQLDIEKHVHFYFFRSSSCPKSHLSLIDKKYYRKPVSSIGEAIAEQHIEETVLFDITWDTNPIFYVQQAAELAQQGKIDGIVTGPLSKPLIEQSGLDVIGHTGLLRKLNNQKRLYMAFMGEKFNVALVTDHIPLKDVARHMNPDVVVPCIVECNKLRKKLPPKVARLPLALLGLNPHAGDSGIIGREESDFLQSIVAQCQSQGLPIVGPLVPDVAFQKRYWQQYSIYIALYHDQGLIPFKMIHGQESGVHITLGLPFLRTSVDHGTAKDIFNQDAAQPESMLEAIQWIVDNPPSQ